MASGQVIINEALNLLGEFYICSSLLKETQRFDYEPRLQPRQIRLVQVWSDATSGRLTCRFKNASLDNLQDKFKAISYCWGVGTTTDAVWVGKHRYLELNGSAAAILHAIAAQKSEGYFWIDAICINQRDKQDKSQQVPLMGEVYSSALRMVAWMGQPSHDSNDAIEFADHLHGSITSLFQRSILVTMESLTQMPKCHVDSPGWTALAHFLQRPWFQRMWIIQEVVLASDVLMICGDVALKWKPLADVVSIISGNGLDRLLSLKSEGSERQQADGVFNIQLVYSMKVLRDSQQPLDLNYNLLGCYNFKATDPRDRVWALLGMSTDADYFKEDVDYENSTAQALFIATTCKQLASKSSFDVLHAAGIGITREITGLPSWVPDWANIPRRTILGGVSKNMLYAAGGTKDPQVKIDQSNRMITLTGVVFDSVESILPPRPLDPTHESLDKQREAKRSLQIWLDTALSWAQTSTQYASVAGRERALWATLTANISYTNGPGTPATAHDFENFSAWREIVTKLASSEDWSQVAFPVSLSMQAQACVHAFSQVGKRTVYMSRKGYMGLGPEKLEENDRIAIFHGAATPFLVRGRKVLIRGRERHSLIGECYMHGLMNGEGLSMGKEE